MTIIITDRKRGRLTISPKRPPRNAKNKRSRGAMGSQVELGKEYEVDITETSPQGEGIGRIRNFLVFVPNAKPGNHLRVKIMAKGAMNAEAKIVQ